jgi:hypothetical protein
MGFYEIDIGKLTVMPRHSQATVAEEALQGKYVATIT